MRALAAQEQQFQFHEVQLKVGSGGLPTMSYKFQFHEVQLKAA